MVKYTSSLVALAASAALMGLACSGAGEDEILDEGLAVDAPDSPLDLGDEGLPMPDNDQCDPEDPNRRYVSTSPQQCAAIRFVCEQGTTSFSDACGCGCEAPGSDAQEIEPEPEEGGEEASNLCGGRYCAEGEECLRYYGVAGTEGPMLHVCGIRCEMGPDGGRCPTGMNCISIADGPGPICQ